MTTGLEVVTALREAATKANEINKDAEGPMVRLRLNAEGIIAHISFKTLHFTRLVRYETILASPYSRSMLDVEIANAVAEIRKAG